MGSPLIYSSKHPSYIDHVARIEGPTGVREYLSAGPPERFLSPRWSRFRVRALGLAVVASAALGGFWVGTTHVRPGQAAGLGEVIAVPGGRPSGEGFGFGSLWVTTWSPTDGVGPGQPTNRVRATWSATIRPPGRWERLSLSAPALSLHIRDTGRCG